MPILPLFAFNWWFTFVDPVFTMLGLLDAAGNLVMLALCVAGWKRAGPEKIRLVTPGSTFHIHFIIVIIEIIV